MGAADIVPGVSGGTVALITGIYKDLLAAIGSIDGTFLKYVLSLQFSKALGHLHLRFLLSWFIGVAVAIVSLARVMHFLLDQYPVFTWSLFFGLILASTYVVGKSVERWNVKVIISGLVGALFAFFLVGAIPVQTPEAAWFIFLAGSIAVCAMILPGISGSFIMLILGKYEYVTGALKNPFNTDSLTIIALFGAGCVIGLISFSKFLNFLLKHSYNLTIAFLTGLMFGSLRKIWPWKETIESVTIRGKLHVLKEENILPPDFSPEVAIAFFLVIFGLVGVLLIEKWAGKKAHS